MVTRREWQDFRNTGLVVFINNILHAFGPFFLIVIYRILFLFAPTNSIYGNINYDPSDDTYIIRGNRVTWQVLEKLIENAK